MAVPATTIPLTLLDAGPVRPAHAQGPRSLDSVRMLRISVTDRCNLRCEYCMPAGGVDFEDRDHHLAPSEIETIAAQAHRLGVRHFKITGGEPTVRSDLEEIVERIARLPRSEVSMTTNGTTLARRAEGLRIAGLRRVTVSIDSLNPERFEAMSGGGRLDVVRRGLDAALANFASVKINTVVIRGRNDVEAEDFVRLAMALDLTVRFIEFMPIGDSACARNGAPESQLVPADELFGRLQATFGAFGALEANREPGVGPAVVHECPGGRGRVGFIHAMSKPFCETCNRLRLSARGILRSCLFDGGEVDLRPLLERRASPSEWTRTFAQCTALKPALHALRGDGSMSAIGG